MFINGHCHDSDRTGDRHDMEPVHSPVTSIQHTCLKQENTHNRHDHANAIKSNPTMTVTISPLFLLTIQYATHTGLSDC